MFFLANKKNVQISNMPGLVALINIFTDGVQKKKLLSLVSSHGFKEENTIINDVSICKIRDWVVFFADGWSLSISVENLLVYENYISTKKENFIIKFDGYNLTCLDYVFIELNKLKQHYLNKDIYVSIGLSNNIYADTYSTNNINLRLLYFLFSDSYGIFLKIKDIQNALSEKDISQIFGSNREVWVKVIDHDYLQIFDNENQYRIYKNVFFKLLNTFNTHEHAANKMCCAKTTIIIDDKDVYVELID